MRNFLIYLAVSLCLFASKLAAQETFETKAKAIAEKIEKITNEEQATLKIEVEEVNDQLEKGSITKDQADEKKKKLAEARATIIENRIAVVQEELKDLVQAKVDGKIGTTKMFKIVFNKSEKNTSINYEKRTTSQFVFAAGLNNLVTEGKVAGSDFRYLGSHFYEWGVTCNTRIMPTNNLIHAKYGFSVMYNNLRPTDNRSFVVNGNQTDLVVNSNRLEESRFKNVYLVAPIHLEFDFSKKTVSSDKNYFRTHQSFRFGIGGYAGICLKSKQILEYKENNLDATLKTKGDFNTSNFIYGLSSYVGYKATSLYFKYDLNPLFRNNTSKQNNVSIGIRFDLN